MVAIDARVKLSYPQEREKMFYELYEQAFPLVAKFVSRMGGSFQDAKDIFQDSLVLFYEKTAGAEFELHTSASAYVTGIAKHLWIRKFKHDISNVSLDAWESSIQIPEDFFSPTTSGNRLLLILERAGKKCLELLRAFYYDKLPVKDLAKMLGYSTSHSVSVQKFKCLEKVRDYIKLKSIDHGDLVE